jgi:hypothetical protein
LWNTPKAADVASQGKRRGGKRRGEGKTDLANQVKLWPTPKATSAKGASETATREGSQDLQTAVKLWPTPRSSPNENRQTKLTPSQLYEGHGKNLATEVCNDSVNGQLNPAWVEWLMGFPEGWTDLKDSATRSCHKSRSKSSKK